MNNFVTPFDPIQKSPYESKVGDKLLNRVPHSVVVRGAAVTAAAVEVHKPVVTKGCVRARLAQDGLDVLLLVGPVGPVPGSEGVGLIRVPPGAKVEVVFVR